MRHRGYSRSSAPKYSAPVVAALMLIVMALDASHMVRAAELVMFRQAGCEWCDVWDEEVGVIYDKTREAAQAPLRQVDIAYKLPDDLRGLRSVHYTPTFVLLDNGREIGRILGYPGEAFFWELLEQLLSRIKNPGS